MLTHLARLILFLLGVLATRWSSCWKDKLPRHQDTKNKIIDGDSSVGSSLAHASRSKNAQPCLLVACIWLACSSLAGAQFDFEGGTIRTRDTGYGVLDVIYFNEQSASGTSGCMHIAVVSPAGPSPAERNLEIVFYANFMRGGPKDGTAIRFPVRLPEGAQRAEVALPYVAPGQANHPGNQVWVMLWDVTVLEDGREITSTRTYRGSPGRVAPITMPPGGRNNYHVMTSSSAGWSMLRLVDDGVATAALQPEMLRLLSATENDPNAALTHSLAAKSDFGISRDSQNIGNIRTLSTAPDDWQYYLQFNYVAFDHALLERMQLQRPSLAEALKQYVAAGGSVLLIGSGPQTAPNQPQKQERGEVLIDRWLSGGASQTSSDADSAAIAQSGHWHKIITPVESWWNRGSPAPWTSQSPSSAGQSMPGQSMPGQPMAISGYNTAAPPGMIVPYSSPSATPQPNQPQAAGSATLQGTSRTNAPGTTSASNATAEIEPLSPGGAARDLLTAAETYAMAEFGTPIGVVDKLIDVATGYGGPMVMSQLTPTGQDFSDVIELEYVFAPVQSFLEEAVGQLQSQEAIGCSWRTYGLGQIGVVEPSLNAQPVETLRELATELSDSASMRINSMHDTAWPWRNLISSVGKPPVWTFCAFVLLFGLLLGPGLLIFTGWMRRRSLLIFLVPFVSLAATLSIAAYEILYEGFDTNIRVTSLITVDQSTGQGFAWSRQTYFSGWPPRSGLEFPKNVYFRPVSTYQNYYGGGMQEPRRAVGNRIEVGEDELRWTGWLGAREQQQLLIGHPAKPTVPLQVTQVNAQRIRIKNMTAEPLPFAAVRDEADWYYLAIDLAPGVEIDCQAQTAYDVGVELTRLRAKHIPVAPPELQGNYGWGWSRRYIAYPTDASTAEMVDWAWHQYMSEHLELPHNGFVTLQESSDAVYVPLQGNVTESKHLIVGRLVW